MLTKLLRLLLADLRLAAPVQVVLLLIHNFFFSCVLVVVWCACTLPVQAVGPVKFRTDSTQGGGGQPCA